MDTSKIRRFAQFARSTLIEQVGVKLEQVLKQGSLARRENEKSVADLEKLIDEIGEEQVIERVAYTWFNRFVALRYMDVNRYTRIGIVSPPKDQIQPEILGEAKMGHIDEEVVPKSVRKQVLNLLDGTTTSSDPQGEAYRLLLVAACNYYHRLMPFMFERIADYTELLLPNDLLSANSILTYTREALLPANCSPEFTDESVEVIGWLYQFYISEKKDDVFAALKKGKKITPENIPAATQLFTPHWIVRYLVENSLGRLWMLNHPDSRLIEQMDYYIAPEEPETDFLQICSPEEIKICDPACGSGHMLTYAFDLLYAIYEEQGYQATDIPRLILTHNLFGIEIDQRAGALAAFALTMKAREKYRRFLTGGKVVQPNICVLENISIDPEDLSAYMDKVGRDLFSSGLQGVVNQWEEADNFGSLIRPLVTDVSEVLELLRERQMGEDLFLAGVHQKVLTALRQADYLSPRYHVVVANPPYMGRQGMAPRLKSFLASNYPNGKSDLMTCFMELATELTADSGYWGMINIPSWMFLTTFEALRRQILKSQSFCSLLQLGRGIFGADFGTVAFTVENSRPEEQTTGVYRRLFKEHVQVRTPEAIRQLFLDETYGRFQYLQHQFGDIPGSPLAYWTSEAFRASFAHGSVIGEAARKGLSCSGTDLFYRHFWEVSRHKLSVAGGKKWFPITKGGEFRKWYGNNDVVLNWEHDGKTIRERLGSNGKPLAVVRNEQFYFKEGGSWNDVTAGSISCRYTPKGAIPTDSGPMLYSTQVLQHIAFLNSSIAKLYTDVLCPTIHFGVGQIANFPVLDVEGITDDFVESIIGISRRDWDSHETSPGFTSSPMVHRVGEGQKIEFAWSEWKDQCNRAESELTALEEENNRRFISTYGFSGEVSPNVEAVTLIGCDCEKDAAEFISYAVGCMLGRYSLDKPGLILANQGETADDYRQQIPDPTFAPDEDNVIPLLDGDWFTDDISERFKEFLKVTFGTEHYEENLTFLENALYPNNLTGKKRKTIRDYFLKEFYNHHIKLYKKRPIYWLFSSPRGTFSALIYMHRYRPDTVSVVLKYLRDFREKIAALIDSNQHLADSADATKADKTRALKKITQLKKDLKDVETYENKILYDIAQKQIEIDLDDGVKVNYNKFGKALKKVTGLTGKTK